MERKKAKIASLGQTCCGCGACAARCPKGCIRMEPDGCGFSYPTIDEDICVACGGCDSVCPVLGNRSKDGLKEVIWAKSTNEEEKLNSSSGGIFPLLAHDVLASGGLVCGAAWDKDFKHVRHVVVKSESELDSIMRSKYVQSSICRDIYEGIRDALKSGRRVLFSGTACQVAGMRAYLGKLASSDGFMAVDVICHGVPSPLLWEKWAEYRQQISGAPLRGVNQRSKTTGWLSYSAAYKYAAEKDGAPFCDGSVFKDDWYMKAFLANASLRSSCFSCPMKRRCGSDITLGDYWEIQAAHPDVEFTGGVSAVLANTSRGASAIEALKPKIEWGESSIDKVMVGNPSLVKPVAPFVKRQEFLRDLESGSPMDRIIADYPFQAPLLRRIYARLRGIVSCMVKAIVKKYA